MKLNGRCLVAPCFILFIATLLVFFSATFCSAGEGATRGRIIYNNIMLIVNFGILVFLFLKYAKKPLMDFLNNERQKREERLNHINAQFEAAKEAMDAEAAKLDNITEYIKKVRENIIEIAKREKEKIVEDAKHTAAKMIKDAEAYSVYQLAKAKRVLSNEMVDLAISVVEEKLKKGITEQDNEILVNRFLTDIEISKELFEKRIKQ